MAKVRQKQRAARGEVERQARETREIKIRLRRLERDQREIAAAAKRLRSAEARAEQSLEALREWLNERSAETFAAAAERAGA